MLLKLVCKLPLILSKEVSNDRSPSPIGNGWGIINGTFRPVRSSLPALPMNIISDTNNSSGSSESEDSDNESSSSSDSEQDE